MSPDDDKDARATAPAFEGLGALLAHAAPTAVVKHRSKPWPSRQALCGSYGGHVDEHVRAEYVTCPECRALLGAAKPRARRTR